MSYKHQSQIHTDEHFADGTISARKKEATEPMKQLKSLPPTDSKFWKHADTNKHDIMESNCTHDFRRTSGTTFQCQCGAGLLVYSPRGAQLVESLSAHKPNN